MMASLANSIKTLQKEGWYLSLENLKEFCDDTNSSSDKLRKILLDIDLKDVGEKCLSDEIARNRIESIQGPFILQVQKVRNVAAPKEDETNRGAPELLRLALSDGHQSCPAIVMENVNGLGLDTPPGSKVCVKGNISVVNGFLLLTKQSCTFLGGKVPKLCENWEIKKSVSKHDRTTSAGGAPKFIPFGQNLNSTVLRKEVTAFRSLDTGEKAKDEGEFEQQRKAVIADIQSAKAEGKQKTFVSAPLAIPEAPPERPPPQPRADGGFRNDRHDRNDDRDREDRGGGRMGGRGRGRGGRGGRRGRGRRGGGSDDDDDDGGAPVPRTQQSLFDFLPDTVKTEVNTSKPTVSAAQSRQQYFDDGQDDLWRDPRQGQGRQQGGYQNTASRSRQQQGQNRSMQNYADDFPVVGEVAPSNNQKTQQKSNYQQPIPQQGEQRQQRLYADSQSSFRDTGYNNRNFGANSAGSRPGKAESDSYGGGSGDRYGGREMDKRSGPSDNVSDFRGKSASAGYKDVQAASNRGGQAQGDSRHRDPGYEQGHNRRKDHDYEQDDNCRRDRNDKRRDFEQQQQPRRTASDVEDLQAAVRSMTFTRSNVSNKPKAGGDPSYNAPTGAMGQPGPQPGDHCLALYVDDGKFYRGMIVSSDISGQTCVVNFTDYASQQVTRLTDIRVVTKQYWLSVGVEGMFQLPRM